MAHVYLAPIRYPGQMFLTTYIACPYALSGMFLNYFTSKKIDTERWICIEGSTS